MSHAEAKKEFLAANLRDSEVYAGLVLGKDGQPDHHLILLRGQIEDKPWKDASDWAAQQGAELPTRRELALLFANLPEHFVKRAYWSSETVSGSSGSAWCQSFYYGGQYDNRKGALLRARAVRRLERGS